MRHHLFLNITKGIPQRINGKVSGKINGLSFQDEDLHSYVVTSDGRAYTAVSKMNESIGFDLQPLSMLGGVVGWLFARSTSINAPNGYQLTGTYIRSEDDSVETSFNIYFVSKFSSLKEVNLISQQQWISLKRVIALSSNNVSTVSTSSIICE